MKTVLILNFPAEGHVNPTLGITKAFSDKGYDVHYISTEKYKKRLEAAGATVHLPGICCERHLFMSVRPMAFLIS
ncbi:hypothetical protein L604_001300000980 [Bacillus subtilis J27]|nr:hypothetical protein L604_001300000980 [Bacillus subtilis J27]